jgi:hypothetical protein
MMTVVLGAAPSNTATSDAVAATLNPGDLQAGPAKFDFSAAAHLVQLLSRLEAMQAASELMQRQQQEIVSTLLQHSNALTVSSKAGLCGAARCCRPAATGVLHDRVALPAF